MLEATLREQHQPVSAEQARSARDSLAPATQAAVGGLVADHGPRARQHLAYQTLGEWSPHEREAIRTLAAASPEVRAQAFGETGASTAGFGDSAEPAAGRVSTPTTRPAAATAPHATTEAPGTTTPAQETNGGTPLRAPQDPPRSSDGGEP